MSRALAKILHLVKIQPALLCNVNKGTLIKRTVCTSTVCASRHLWLHKWQGEVYKRYAEAGPDEAKPRSQSSNWNYDSELYSFGKRLGEDFNENTIKTAFRNKCYVEDEVSRQTDMGLTPQPQEHNDQLAAEGEAVAERYTKAYLRHSYPALPEEAISDICENLLSTQTLVHVASNLGVADLIIAKDWPHSDEIVSHTFKAVIGALAHDQGVERAQLFVQDFLLTQLVGKDLFEMWQLSKPIQILQGILEKQDRGAPEPRLLWKTGIQTPVPAYMVGIYSDKQLLGKGYGESVSVAQDMAARDALRNFFGLALSQPSLPLGKQGHSLQLDMNRRNIALQEVLSSSQHINP